MVISFSGLDGSGKSTQIAMLATWLRAQGTDCRIVETHALTLYSTLGRLIKACSPSTGRSLVKEHYNLGHNSSRRRFVGWLRNLFFWVDVLNFSFKIKFLLDRRDRVVLCDRSLVDEAIQLTYLGFCSTRGLLCRLWACPSVTRGFYLSASPEAAHARKPEYPMEHFRKKAQLYGLATKTGNFTPCASSGLAETHASIKAELLGLLKETAS
jgi:thymidylate kinase